MSREERRRLNKDEISQYKAYKKLSSAERQKAAKTMSENKRDAIYRGGMKHISSMKSWIGGALLSPLGGAIGGAVGGAAVATGKYARARRVFSDLYSAEGTKATQKGERVAQAYSTFTYDWVIERELARSRK